MPRFDKLEFNPERKSPQRPEELVNGDENHWMKRADEDRRLGQYENALKYYSRALEMNKSLVAGWVGQVQMLVLLQEFPEAELWSRKALELFPQNGELMASRAQAYCRMSDWKQAYSLCDGALQQEGQSAYRWIVRGEIMVANRQTTAGPCFEKAVQMDPDWLVPLEIALVYLCYRTPSRGVNYARRAVELAHESVYTWYVQGLCESQLGLNGPARRSFEHCLELAPKHVEAERRLGELEHWGWSLVRRLRRLLRIS